MLIVPSGPTVALPWCHAKGREPSVTTSKVTGLVIVIVAVTEPTLHTPVKLVHPVVSSMVSSSGSRKWGLPVAQRAYAAAVPTQVLRSGQRNLDGPQRVAWYAVGSSTSPPFAASTHSPLSASAMNSPMQFSAAASAPRKHSSVMHSSAIIVAEVNSGRPHGCVATRVHGRHHVDVTIYLSNLELPYSGSTGTRIDPWIDLHLLLGPAELCT